MENKLEIKTATIEIKAIYVGEQKMTVSTFEQITTTNVLQINDFVFQKSDDFWFKGDLVVLGWVRWKSKIYVLFSSPHGELYKQRISGDDEVVINEYYDQLFIAT